MQRPDELRDYERMDVDQERRPATYGERSERGLTSRQEGQGGSSGQWRGFVVPYRYYGPGYRGLGYYSVFYLGRDEAEAEEKAGQVGEPAPSPQAPSSQSWQESYGQGGRRGRSGGQAGRGPRGYQRSDERIKEDLNDRLMADDELDASDLEVTVKQGEVTLSGTVPDRESKRRAEDIAESVMGVQDVMNQVRVGSSAGSGDGSSGRRASSRSTSSSSRRSTPSTGQARSTASRSERTSGSTDDDSTRSATGSNGQRERTGSSTR